MRRTKFRLTQQSRVIWRRMLNSPGMSDVLCKYAVREDKVNRQTKEKMALIALAACQCLDSSNMRTECSTWSEAGPSRRRRHT